MNGVGIQNDGAPYIKLFRVYRVLGMHRVMSGLIHGFNVSGSGKFHSRHSRNICHNHLHS